MGNTVNDRELILEILLAVTRDGEYSHCPSECAGELPVSG